MTRPTLVLDGLWLSLCPSFNQLALGSGARLARRHQHIPEQCLLRLNRSTPVDSRRYYRSRPKETPDNDSPSESPRSEFVSLNSSPSNPTSPPKSNDDSIPKSTYGPYFVSAEDGGDPKRMVRVRQYPRVPESYDQKSTTSLENMLRYITAKDPHVKSTMQVLRALIRDRKVEPHARHYRALILANCDCKFGSPEAVRGLLQEMEENNITADSGTLHAALKALAVHPDYILRQEILRKLRDRWLTISPDGWHFMVAGYLREHQFELALDQISLMERKGIHIENWLHSMAIYQLCEFDEFDEVYRLMQARVEQGHDMTPELWGHVLAGASQHSHYDLTRFIWRRMVDLEYLHPGPDVSREALAVASYAGDISLALAILRFCEASDYAFGASEYENVLKIYLQTGDLYAAFSVLCTVGKAGLEVDEEWIQAIVSYMIEHNTSHWDAWSLLKRLKKDNPEVSIDCVRVVAELCEHLAQEEPSVVKDAIGFYKELYTLRPQGADVHVYNSLVRMCRHGKDSQSGLFLVKEMASLGIPPDPDTFEALVLLCLDAGNYESAYKYLEDLLRLEDGIVSEETRLEIRSMCSDSVNEFAVRLQSHPLIQEPSPQATSQILKRKSRRRWGRTWYRPAYYRQMLSHEDRIAWNKKRRQNKRRNEAIARHREKTDLEGKGFALPEF
ncbi:hypothetical protein N7478_008472 [Penicillium angulare]|uniref:uncharacterized protein n=1 Tax=Penicillium angulare TaxID=116970 RepID=UPI002540B89B|nr:uncharacterized protein N7478_008472 [Penicillium angulare]KAJ5273347.1 hypothetical protein N7478_008472 [Penicillium angulare]